MTIPGVTWKVGDRLGWKYVDGSGYQNTGVKTVTCVDSEYTILSDGWGWANIKLLKFWALIPPAPPFKTGDRVLRTSHDLGPKMSAGMEGVVESVGSIDMLVRTTYGGIVLTYPINGGYWEHAPSAPVSDKILCCKKCGDGFPMAVANQPDGSMVCWSCRNRR